VLTHVLSESVLLSLAGGAVGLLLARWAIGAFMAAELPLGLPAPIDLRLDPRMMMFTAGLALLTGITFGLIPAWRLSRSDVVSSLRDDVTPLTFRQGRINLRNGLVVGQVAVSFVLLVIAGLFVRSLGAAQQAEIGFDPSGIAAVSADLAHSGYEPAEARTAFNTLRERVAALPGVDSASLALQVPVRGGGGSSTLIVDGYVDPNGTEAVEVTRAVVGPGYFRTLGVPLLQGRTFEDTDNNDSSTVIVISESMARAYWGTTEVVGGRVRGQGGDPDSWMDVVGVVGDVNIESVTDAPEPVFYLSTGQSMGTRAYVIARTAGSPDGLLAPMRDALRAIEPTVPILELTTMEQHLAGALQTERFTARLLSGFGVLGLLLAAIRMALGAGRPQVVRMVIGEVMSLIVVALVIGLGAALLVSPGVSSVLYGVSPMDPVTLAATAALLALTAALATWLPARRAASVDPVRALRTD